MIATFKVLSLLLTYPTRDICAGAGEFRDALVREDLLPQKVRRALEPLLRNYEQTDIYDLQEEYVLLFDRTKVLSLHLFEHIHGESRDRGQAMVNLKETYEAQGLGLATNELPDFLPAFLEFLSQNAWEDAIDYLNQPLHVLVALKERLSEMQSPYAAVFGALEALASEKVAIANVRELLKTPTDDPNNLEEIDKAWEEAAVEFGPTSAPDADCPKASEMLRRFEIGPVSPAAPLPRD